MFLEADGSSSADDAPILDDWADLEEGYLRPRLQPVPEPVYFPFNSGAMRGKVVKPSVLEAPDRKVTWTTSTVWRLPIHLQLSNIWFWGSRVMPVYRALRMNNTRVLNPPLPPFGEGDLVYVPMPSHDFKGAWFDATLAIATGGKPRVEYLDTWGSQWNTNNWVCMKHAVSSGTFAGVVSEA